MKASKFLMILTPVLLCLTLLMACTSETPAGSETQAATEALTTAPTETVTEAPTEIPTQATTEAPTEAATETPTEAPTEVPTEAPSEAPTEAPTEMLTEVPTEMPTEVPTEAATEPKETETAMPRFDYFEEEIGTHVTLDKSVYESMTLKLPASLQITDEDVQSYIQYLIFQEREATNGNTKVTDQALKLGDTAYIYYRGTIDGVEFEGGSNMEDTAPYGLGLGSGSFIPGFEDGLVGVIPNQTSKESPAEVHVTFPEDYTAELAGKEAIFYVVVEYAVQYTLPEYNRAFVENVLEYESEKTHVTDKSFLTEFEEYLKALLEEQNKEYVDSAKTDALWTYLTETAVCTDLPQLELNYYKTVYTNELLSAYDYYKSYYGEDFLKAYPTIGEFAVYYMGFEKGADWEEELDKITESMVKKDMIVHAIAEWENMETVTDEEFEAEIQYWMEYYGSYNVTREDILKNIGEDYLRESAFATKMYDYLMGNCTFEYEEA